MIYRVLLGLLIIVAIAFGYTKVMARIASGIPPVSVEAEHQADHIYVSKDDRMMYLMQDEIVLKSYSIAMGAQWDAGPKQREGDERTPEGSYHIDWRNPRSVAHLSLHISYPDSDDRARGQENGYDPGSNIMIHGLPNGWGALGSLHRLLNWTDGCIAVTNSEMQEIWSFTPNQTPITIVSNWSPNNN
ncbi:L,D-transpeptidase family protein [Sagittula sp. NFXS13]|uniref:L,D-transpeptidase family protein n=1 Tax=Sagittula sp. NFXS13 TaxID=2819095 RepID=UPI0032DFC4ED